MTAIARIWTILKKDLKRAPRSGILILCLVYPALLTLLLQVIFGGVFDPAPRVGLVPHAESPALTAALSSSEALELTTFDDADAMWRDVEGGRLDVGIVPGADFDKALQSGGAPDADVRISSRANGQALLKFEGVFASYALKQRSDTPIVIEQVGQTDNPPLTWIERLIPLLLLLTVFVAGTFLTGFAVVDEKLRGTLRAILMTPTALLEVALAKGILSFGVALICALLTLYLNGAIAALSPALTVVLIIAAVMTIELGVIVGLLSKDMNTFYGVVKGVGPIIALTAMPFLWDGWPKWVSQCLPTWYSLDPIMRIVNDGAGFNDIRVELAVSIGICIVLAIAARFVASRVLARLGG